MSDPAAPAKTGTPRATWIRIMAIGGIGTVLAIVNIATDSEAPSQAVALLEYLGLGLGVLALVGGLIGFTSAK